MASRIEVERKLYERLTVYLEDLNQAAYFANYLLKKGWHFDPWDRKIRLPTYMRQAAFTTALVTAYCRPFTETRAAPSLSMKLAPYTANEYQLHARLKALRNTVYAHSDIELQQVRPVSIYGQASAIVRLPVLKLTKGETESVVAMIRRTSAAIDAKRQSLIERVL
jgi:hypothetical protein